MTNFFALDPHRFTAAAAAGLRVFPLKPREKKPALPWKQFQDRAPTDEELALWDSSNLNGAIVTGAPSGIVVLDVDSCEAQELVDTLNLPPTPVVRTAQGLHYYFRRPAFEVRNGVRLGGVKLDIRGDGGFVVAPGSLHPSGVLYEWVVSPTDVPFAAYPEALQHLRGDSQTRTARAGSAGGGSDLTSESRFHTWLQQRLKDAKSELAKEAEGGRNDRLFRVAVRVASDVAAAGEDWAGYADALTRVALDIGLDDEEIAATLGSAWRSGSETATSWIKLAQEWIYISGADQFQHLESGQRLSQQAFRTEFNHMLPVKRVGNITRFLMDGGYVDVVQNISFDPQRGRGIFEANGRRWLNTYVAPGIVPQTGDASPFEEFITYLVPAAEERDHLLKMIAHLVRNPGQKLNHALIFGSRAHGIGKSTLLEIMFELLGSTNCRKATTEEIESPYQSYVEGKLLVLVEEINFGVGRKAYNKLKDLVTATVTPVRRLYQETREVPNMATFVFLTNLDVPILIDEEDRRIFMINSPAEPREAEYYVAFNQWWRANLGVVRHFLDTVDLDAFDPHARPPMTGAKAALIESSRTPVVQELMAMIEERQPPFRTDVVTLREIIDAVNLRLPKTSRPAIQAALRQIGAVNLGQHRIGAGMRVPFGSGDRPCLWAIRHPNFWADAPSREIVEEYLAQVGLLAGLPPLPSAIAVSRATGLTEFTSLRQTYSEERVLSLVQSLNS